jgi:hypothetical protein
MTAPQGFTAFLTALQHATSYHGLESFHELGRDDLPAERTIYRWQQAVGENLTYFPSIAWQPLGLTHAHLFITNATDEWFTFPFAIDAAWLARSPVERVLYLHCLVPIEHETAFARLLDELRLLGIAATIKAYFTGDSWQDHDEPRRPPLVPPGSALREHAFLIPVACENQERRLSLHDLWTTIYGRLGHRTWFYLPHQRRLKTNGKRYVKQAFAGMNQAQLFRQLVTRNRLDLEMNVEVFLLLDPAAAVDEIAVRLQAHSVSVEHAVGRRESLVRALGGVRLLYAIMALPERLTLGSTGLLLDRNRTLAEPTRVRFCYELLFNPNQAQWLFPRAKILAHMHVSP